MSYYECISLSGVENGTMYVNPHDYTDFTDSIDYSNGWWAVILTIIFGIIMIAFVPATAIIVRPPKAVVRLEPNMDEQDVQHSYV